MFFRFYKYKYKPSYEIKTSTKIHYLLEKYENIFLKYIDDKNTLTEKEKEILFSGIKEVSVYIINGLFYQILENYSSKSGIAKKAEALYNIAKYQYHDIESFKDYIEEELIILAEDSIYEAIGLSGDITYKKTTDNSNIISYLKSKLFYKFIKFLEERVNSFKNSSFNLDVENLFLDDLDKELYIKKLISESKLDLSLPEETINRLKDNLLLNKIDEDLIPYVEFLSNMILKRGE